MNEKVLNRNKNGMLVLLLILLGYVAGIGGVAFLAGFGYVLPPALFIVLMALCILGSLLLLNGLFLIEATVSFFSVRSIEMVNVLTYGGKNCCQYPMDIFPEAFRWVFICLAPYGLTMHLPAAYILGKSILDFPVWAAFAGPMAGVVFLVIMFFIWRRGVAHYTSTGS